MTGQTPERLYASGDFSIAALGLCGSEFEDHDHILIGKVIAIQEKHRENLHKIARFREDMADNQEYLARLDRALARQDKIVHEELASLLTAWWPGFARMRKAH